MKNAFESKVGAYSLAAGAAALGVATVAQGMVVAGNTAGMTHYDFTASPIFVGLYASDGSEWISGVHDALLIKEDGTVLTNPLDESIGQVPTTTFFTAADKTDAIWFTLHNNLGDKGGDYAMLAHAEAWSGDGIEDQAYGSAGTVFFDPGNPIPVLDEAYVQAYVNYSVWGMVAQSAPGSYLGFRINDTEGWMRVSVSGARNEITLYEMAMVPEPATMSVLAVGAAGLLARRKRK
jgi:hypothetical protein